MKKTLRRIGRVVLDFIYEPDKFAMREKAAFKAGQTDRKMGHDTNRFREGTEAHRLWEKGYRYEENHEMTIW